MMKEFDNIIKEAICALEGDEYKLTSTSSHAGVGTAVTRFSAALTAGLARSLMPKGELTAHFSTKGNVHRTIRDTDSAENFRDLVRGEFSRCKIGISGKELLLDFIVTSGNNLDVLLTAESEAVVLGRYDEYRDLDKLLLVSSPYRVFIGRVNVTKSGAMQKVERVQKEIETKLKMAVENHILRPTDVIKILLFKTGSYRVPAYFVGSYNAGNFMLSEVEFEPS